MLGQESGGRKSVLLAAQVLAERVASLSGRPPR
jgi:hypothetical protein